MRLVCALLPFLMTGAPGFAEAPGRDISPGVRQAVMGIISYTRWPRPQRTLRLCVVGQPGYAGAVLAGAMQIGDTSVAVGRKSIGTDALGEQCDAVYAGAMTQAERHMLGAQLAGHAVLSITEDDPTCSGIIMFCLDTRAGGTHVGFAVNLDSVARSGVQVNPRVLLLGRRAQAAP